VEFVEAGPYKIDIDGVGQAYEVRGQGPVAVVHSGGPGIGSEYLRMPLLEQHLTMVYLDPIGTGRSDLLPGGDYSVPVYARFVRELISRLGVTRPYFIGHSHGGFVGLELAAENPGLLGGLIAYSTAGVFGPELREEADRQMDAFVRRFPDRPEAVKARQTWAEGSGTPPTSAEVHRRYLEAILPAYFADYWRTIAEIGPISLTTYYDPHRILSTWDVRDRLGRIDVPALVVSGKYDFICPRVFADELAAGIPDVTYLKLDESGHFGYVEQQDRFVKAIADFVS
jgi:pimeloyl-ACP methyl ester carboxylesterase